MFPVLAFSLSLSALASPDGMDMHMPWRRISDPLIMSTTFVRSYSNLPLEAKVTDDNKYWSGDYWGLKKGNLNYRWNSPRPQGFNLKSPTKETALAMSKQELSYLSPSEKYSILIGDFNYKLVKEIAQFTSPDRAVWEGMCHGWAPASQHHNEPTPKVAHSVDGIEVPFGTADIKGLITYFYAYDYSPVTSRQMGLRCNGWTPWGTDRCRDDMNAGAFHIVLTNKIGLAGTSFVADIENGTEVWNHVPVKYRITVLNENLPPESDSARGTVRTVRVRNEVTYVYETDKNTWEPVLGTPLQKYVKKTYEYSLDLNANGIILGGNWKSRTRPDFLWLVDRVPELKGRWTMLNQLLND